MPVPTTVRWPGPRTTSRVVTRSAPASPGWQYLGTGTPGSSRVSRTSRGSASVRSGHTGGETTLGRVADRQPPHRRQADTQPAFDERLAVPWWWWPLGLGVAALLAAEVHMGYPGVRAWLPYVLIIPFAGVVLGFMGRHHVALRNGELR